MKKLYNILVISIIFIVGLTGISITYTSDYSAYDVAPQMENVPYKNKLDLFLNKVLEAREGFSTEKNYIVFVSKIEDKLSNLRETYSGNQEISSMLSYLEEGVKNIRNISRQNNELEDFFCELFGDCEGSNDTKPSDDSNSDIDFNDSSNTYNTGGANNKLNWKLLPKKHSFTNISDINNKCGNGYRILDNDDWGTIISSGDLFNDTGKSLNYPDGYYWTSSSDVFYIYGGNSGYIINIEDNKKASNNSNSNYIVCKGSSSNSSNSSSNNSNLESSTISSNGIVSCKFEGDKDTLSISGKKWCEYARDKNKFGDRFQVSSSQKLLTTKVVNGDLDCRFESYGRTRTSKNICNNTDFIEYISYVKGNGLSNPSDSNSSTSSSNGNKNSIPKLKCPSSWSWGKSGSTERCTKSGGHYSCPDITGFGAPVGKNNPNHWTNVNGKITTCYYTYKGSNNNSGDSSNVRVASSGFGKVVEYFTCGTKENGPNKRTYFFDEDKWNSRKSTTIDGTKGPWVDCNTCHKYKSRSANTLCGNDKIVSSSSKSYINLSTSKTNINISTKNVPNGGGIVTLYGYIKSGDKCRINYSTKGSSGSSSLASGKTISSTYFVTSRSNISIKCDSNNYNFDFNESGVTGVMCEGGDKVGGHFMTKGAKGSTTTKKLHTGDSKGRYTQITKFKCNNNLKWEVIPGSKTITYSSCKNGYIKKGNNCIKENSTNSVYGLMVTVYEPKSSNNTIYINLGPNIQQKNISLALSSYEKVNWFINNPEGYNIKKVVLQGYENQTVSSNGSIGTITNDSGRGNYSKYLSEGNGGWIYSSSDSKSGIYKSFINSNYGFNIDKHVGKYSVDHFDIGGYVGFNGGSNSNSSSSSSISDEKLCYIYKDNNNGTTSSMERWLRTKSYCENECIRTDTSYTCKWGGTIIRNGVTSSSTTKTRVKADSRLDCSIKKDKISNLYYGVGRCPDKGGYDYWTNDLKKYTFEQVKGSFNHGIYTHCIDAAGTSDTKKCFDKMFCPSGYSYIRNTEYCEKK